MEWTAVKKISTSDFQIEAGGTKIGEDILLYVKGGEKASYWLYSDSRSKAFSFRERTDKRNLICIKSYRPQG